MKQAVVTIKYEEEKLNAIKQYMGKKDADFESELNEVLGKCMKICSPGRERIHRQQGRCSGSHQEKQ